MSSDDTAQLDQPAEPDEQPSEPDELDDETRLRRDAALARVRKLGDPVLRASAVAVERFDAELSAEIEAMGELMNDALGVGLAANQVGILHRVLVYRADPDEPITALVNPVIEWLSDELAAAQEGCLSIPDVHVEVERPARIRARARDAAGGEIEIEADGLEARVIQHEVDHLDGILILDRISREARRDAMRAAREAREARAAAPAGQPSAGAPDARDPEAGDPDARETGGPDARDAGGSDTGGSDARDPDAGGPDAGGPDAGGPDTGGPDVRGPDVGGPDMRDPDAGGPDAGGPDMRDPDATTV
ncbi:MAG TPA: peptide deformylase [Solirubrobacteraceae bacterium]|nr:peptide deformylase [Solirubrobacteraceae bacterium]